ncbi:transglycosylase SLT domain-containing protein [Geomonas sp. Red32]|uniref:transglycosylase SLT domain-containing protein n=1 Tax=Geomonas sp. Red32 TaxID=2912856 RepID=UPI00202CBFF3|nr:transglycosylase SLT domain-containing protein [Geomonas sp. Red32]MCM0080626.1 transglycosylase SLT domain-containing protein [Geomonas sp. Red32]
MSIDPVAAAQQGLTPTKNSTSPQGSTPGTHFQQVLEGTGKGEPVSPATAAEILRLKMLNSAMNLGDDNSRQGNAVSAGVQSLLDRFLEQLPKESPVAAWGTPQGTGQQVGDALEGDGGGSAAAPVSGGLDGIIQKASQRYGVDGGLIKAVIKAESDFNPRAVSPVGAQGLMQLMPSTARGLGVTDAFDPEQNVMAGTRFLKDLLSRYGGNVDEALAAYNWGPGRVDRHGTDRLPKETRLYLAKVKSYYSQYAA